MRRYEEPVALIGYGRWGRHVLRDLVALGAAVTVVARSDPSREEALDAGAARVTARIDDLREVRAAVVATPTTTHAEVVAALLDLDVPVFCEKPLTDDPVTARELAAAASDRLFVMHKWRYHPGVEALASIARSGELGPVVGVRTTRVGWGNPHGDVDGIWMLAPHDLSIALELLGSIPPARFAVAERVSETATGLWAALGDDPWLALEVSSASPVRRREVRLVCRDGVAVLLDPFADHILVTRGRLHSSPIEREDEHRPISLELPLLRELRAFLEHVEGGPAPRSSAAEGAAEVGALARLRELAGLPLTSVMP